MAIWLWVETSKLSIYFFSNRPMETIDNSSIFMCATMIAFGSIPLFPDDTFMSFWSIIWRSFMEDTYWSKLEVMRVGGEDDGVWRHWRRALLRHYVFIKGCLTLRRACRRDYFVYVRGVSRLIYQEEKDRWQADEMDGLHPPTWMQDVARWPALDALHFQCRSP